MDEVTRSSLPPTILDAARALRKGLTTSQELVSGCLERIERLDGELNSFIALADDAMATAVRRDEELDRGEDRGPLHGVPVSLKDLFDVCGMRTTVGSKVFQDAPVAVRDSAVARSLKRAGAVIIGKNNMAEFAADMTGRNHFHGDIVNPRGVNHTPGGSSGGTAVAVAAGLVFGGVGSDTGASIRMPASCCGVLGLRPTQGVVSCDGVFPRAPSLDVAGPLARTVSDLAVLFEAIVIKYDPSRHARRPIDPALIDGDVDGVRVGVIAQDVAGRIHPDVEQSISAAVGRLEGAGARVMEIEQPTFMGPDVQSALMDILLFEFGEIFAAWPNVRLDDLGPFVQADLRAAHGVSRQAYQRAMGRRNSVAASWLELFQRIDVLVTPAQASLVPARDAEPEVYQDFRPLLSPASYVGVPALAMPCGLDSAGLPLAVQLIGRPLDEAGILNVAQAVEAANCEASPRLSADL